MKKLGILRLCVLASLVGTASLAHAESVRLNFGVYSSNKPSAMVKVFKPTLQELESRMTEKLGRDVDIRMQIAKDYDQGISHLLDGRVDFSRFGPASYIEAKRMNEGVSILAVENVKSSKVFYGIIAVAKDSDLTDIKQIRGKSFAFGDEGSTIGRFLSQLHLEQNGIHAGDLSRYEYLGRHDKVGTAVGAGDFDAGALNEKTFKKLVEAGENIRELVRFPNVTKPWIARPGLDPEVFAALQESLLEIENEKALAAMKIQGFLEGSDEDYSVIRRAMENNQAFFADPIESIAQVNNAGNGQAIFPVDANAVSANSAAGSAVDAQLVTTGNSEILRSGNQITVNITLPSNIFKTDVDGSSAPNNQVTINLLIPSLSAESEDVRSAELAD